MAADVLFESRFVRRKKAEWMDQWYKSFEKKTDIGYKKYENATIIPLKRFPEDDLLFGRGGVIDSQGDYIDSSAIKDRVEGKYDIAQPELEDKTVVYCGYLIDQWGHFLIEAVSRLWFFLLHDNPSYKYVFFFRKGENHRIEGNYKEFLRLLGILDRVELIIEPVRYREVIIPEVSFDYLHFYTDQYRDIYNTVISRALETEPIRSNKEKRKIFISRSHFPKSFNSEVGLDMLDNFFSKNEFDIIYPESMSLTELIILIYNSSVVATESGSTSHNVLFAEDKKNVLIIERQTIVNRVQSSIDCVRNLSVTYVDADLMIYPVIMGFGPFFISFNSWFKSFADSFGMIEPDNQFLNEEYIQTCLKQYLMIYRRNYGLKLGAEGQQPLFANILYEAYLDSMNIVGKFLSDNSPFYYSCIKDLEKSKQKERHRKKRLAIKCKLKSMIKKDVES